jgi:magnesium transporter
VLHFPALRHSHKTREQEIDFIIGKDFLITTHYDVIDPLHKFAKIFEVHSIVDKTPFDHAGFLFFAMLKKLYKAVEHEVEYVRHDLSVIEEHVFSEHQLEMVAAISRSARDLLNLRQVVEPHREVLHTLESEGPKLFGEDFVVHLRTLSNEYYRVHNHIMRETESLHELRETNNSLLTTRQNETLKIFTIMAFITFPLSLIVTILSMNTVHNPIRGLPYDFWIVISIMGIVSLMMVWYFRNKKWM